LTRTDSLPLVLLIAAVLAAPSCSRHQEDPIEGGPGAAGKPAEAGHSGVAQAQSAPSRPATGGGTVPVPPEAAAHAAKLSDTSAPVRTAAAAALVKLGVAAAPLVIDQVRGGDMHVVAAASRILSDMGPSVVPVLRGTISDPNDNVRMVSVFALLELGQNALPALAELSAARNDANPRVKYLAIRAVKVATNDQTDIEVERRAREEAERRRDGK
jgi:hypothetical protein